MLDILAILYKEHAMADGNLSLGEDCCICILWLFTGLMSLAEIGVFIWVRSKVFKNLIFYYLRLFKGCVVVFPHHSGCAELPMEFAFILLIVKIVSKTSFPYFGVKLSCVCLLFA